MIFNSAAKVCFYIIEYKLIFFFIKLISFPDSKMFSPESPLKEKLCRLDIRLYLRYFKLVSINTNNVSKLVLRLIINTTWNCYNSRLNRHKRVLLGTVYSDRGGTIHVCLMLGIPKLSLLIPLPLFYIRECRSHHILFS